MGVESATAAAEAAPTIAEVVDSPELAAMFLPRDEYVPGGGGTTIIGPDGSMVSELRLVVIGQAAAPAPDTTKPTTPTGLTATAGDARIVLSWAASTDNVGVTGYRVRRGTTVLASPTGTTYTVTGLTNGTPVTDLTVTALDAGGNESTAATFPPATPTAGTTPPAATVWTTDFSAQTVGAAPTGFPLRWVTDSTLSIAADATAPSGKALRLVSSSAGGRSAFSWDTPGELTDAEMLVLWKSDFGSVRPILRGAGTASSETGYAVGNKEIAAATNPSDYQVSRYATGAFTNLGTVAAALTANAWHYTRTRVVGSTIQSRTWERGTTEPTTWAIERTDTAITTPGWVGLFVNRATSTVDIGSLSVAAGGATAP